MTGVFEQTRRMQALVGELWRLEGPKVENHVGDVAWQRFQHAGREGKWRIRLWEEDGEPVAWAWVRRPPMLQIFFRRRDLAAGFEMPFVCTPEELLGFNQ